MTFDPRLFKTRTITEADRVVWTSENVKWAYEAFENGEPLAATPWLTGNPQCRKPNLLFSYTKEEINEIIKCKNDIIYFSSNYAQFFREDSTYGLVDLHDGQLEFLDLFQHKRFLLWMAARQIGHWSLN